jgi:hypothetical protein
MATLSSTKAPALTAETLRPDVVCRSKRRRTGPEAGHALEILGHAIEYMADELNAGDGPVAAGNPRLEAIQMLMAINRRIYCECPEIPTWRERLSGWFHSGGDDRKR